MEDDKGIISESEDGGWYQSEKNVRLVEGPEDKDDELSDISENSQDDDEESEPEDPNNPNGSPLKLKKKGDKKKKKKKKAAEAEAAVAQTVVVAPKVDEKKSNLISTYKKLEESKEVKVEKKPVQT